MWRQFAYLFLQLVLITNLRREGFIEMMDVWGWKRGGDFTRCTTGRE